MKYRYHHIGIPTDQTPDGAVHLEKYGVWYYGMEHSLYGIEWMRYEEGCTLPEIVKTVPHVAFEVDDLDEAIRGKKVIITPNSPSDGCVVAFIEENGAPVEFIQFLNDKQ
jgi:hypothetical protein